MKNLTIYRSPIGWIPNLEALNNNLSVPGKTGYGWKIMRDDKPYLQVGNDILLTCEKQEKLLPASVVNRELANRLADIEKQLGYKPGKKQKSDIRMQVMEELAIKAFTGVKPVNVWINTKHDILCIDTTSDTVADDVFSMLVRGEIGYRGHKLRPEKSIAGFMRVLIMEEQAGNFSLGNCLVIEDPAENSKKITYKNEKVNSSVVKNYVNTDRVPVKLDVIFDPGNDSGCRFTIDERMVISKIKLTGITEEEYESEEERFDGDFKIHAGMCISLINELIEHLGEERHADI